MNWQRQQLSARHVPRWGRAIFLIAICSLGFSLRAGERSAAPPIDKQLMIIREETPDLDWHQTDRPEASTELDSAISRYFEFYGLDLPCARRHFGYISAGKRRIATHVFVPGGSTRGTVVVVHGYYDHTATWRHAIRELLAAGFAVLIYDQPGHGLSGGQRATIGDFSEYVTILQAMAGEARKHLPGPYHLAAHSMGCAISVDYLLNEAEDGDMNRVLFIAPLVRSSHWHLSNGGTWLTKPFAHTLPRAFRDNSSDKAYLEFVKQDPLHAHRLPLSWVDALRRWNERAEKFTASPRHVMIIQGDRDRTVDSKYNLPFLKRLFPDSRVLKVEGGGHQLLNETEPLRRKTLDAMSSFFKGGTS